MSNVQKESISSGDKRRYFILIILSFWIIFGAIVYYNNSLIPNESFFYVLSGIIILYIFDLIFSIVLSKNATESLKSFIFQTAIPLSSLILVFLLSYTKSIDSSATITLFGLSLGYTTYVVGKKLKPESNDTTTENNLK